MEKFEHAGLTCEIHYEEDGSHCDPRDWDNLGVMYCWHPDYILGDEQFTRDDFASMGDVPYHIKSIGGMHIMPLCIYDHSSVTMYIGSSGDYPFDSMGWDTTHVGFIYTTPERIKEMGTDADRIEACLRQEVETYASWLRGEVYWWRVVDSDGETLDACGGYVGDFDYVKKEAMDNAEYHAKEIAVNTEPNFPEGLRV